MTVALLLITDDPSDYEQAMVQARTYLPRFQQVRVVDDSDHELGFAGAIQRGWEQIDSDWVFHFESDFRFAQKVPIREMVRLLERQRHLVQVALKRQPVNTEEKEAGGIVEQWPDEFAECSDQEATWTEHRRFFTTNPSIYSGKLCRMGWPQEPRSEEVFTRLINRDPLARYAFWGSKYAEPLVEHVGQRAGMGY